MPQKCHELEVMILSKNSDLPYKESLASTEKTDHLPTIDRDLSFS